MAQDSPNKALTLLDQLPLALTSGRNVSLLAGAGTGKTTSLVHTVTLLFLLEEDLEPEEVLLITFTEKAAAEMRERVTSLWHSLFALASLDSLDGETLEGKIPHPVTPLLSNLLTEEKEKTGKRLAEMVRFIPRLSINTIHSFCLSLLREYSLDAGVDPLFEVLDGEEKNLAFQEAFHEFLEEEFGKETLDDEWAAFFESSGGLEEGMNILKKLMSTIVLDQRDAFLLPEMSSSSPNQERAFIERFVLPPLRLLKEFISSSDPPDPDLEEAFRSTEEILNRWEEFLEKGEIPPPPLLDELALRIRKINGNRVRSRKRYPLTGEEVVLPTLKRWEVREEEISCSFAKIRDSLLSFRTLLASVSRGKTFGDFLLARARKLERIYEEKKGGKVDFLDLLIKAWRLLEERVPVREEVKNRIRHIFVDEFQDTDPIQVYILSLICEGDEGRFRGGTLFIVGDPKQSIYRFRRADPQLYHAIHRKIVEEGGFEAHLPTNYRSRPGLLSFINDFFPRVFSARTDYAFPYGPPLEAARRGEEESPLPPVILFAPRDDTIREVASFIRALIDSELPVSEGGVLRKMTPGDIAVLYRGDYGGKVVEPLKNSLEEEGVPVIFTASKGFFQRQEVQDLIHLLEALVDPEARAPLYGALKSFFFGFTDTDLLPLFVRGEEPGGELARALSLLDKWRALKDTVPLHHLLETIFRDTGARITAATLPEPERTLLMLEKFIAMGRAFWERTRGTTRQFLSAMKRQVFSGSEEGEFPLSDEGEDAVRIFSIHRAKGLEFPVVVYLSQGEKEHPPGPVLIDRVRNISALVTNSVVTPGALTLVGDESCGREIPFFHLEKIKDDHERLRLSYVAMTRARDCLVVVPFPGGSGGESDHPREVELLLQITGDGEGESDTLERFPIPGKIRRGEGYTLYHVESLPDREKRRETPSPPRLEISVSEDEPAPPLLERKASDVIADARSLSFGKRVHQLFELLPPFDPDFPERAYPLVSTLFLPREKERVEKLIERVKEDPFRKRFLGKPLLGREVPLIWKGTDHTFRDAADVVIEEGDGFVVVDYKTGQVPPPDVRQEHELQVKRYCRVIRNALGAPVRGYLWYVEEGKALEVIE
ncbi:MAG: hypothetical protein D6713_06155 [Deltaproteobacteria bacterium]|nr:MAG: hypothetical protein D6713_06155 [Deltaproteobacteria bacterium]